VKPPLLLATTVGQARASGTDGGDPHTLRYPHAKVQFRAQPNPIEGTPIMGAEDKASNKIDDLGGKAKAKEGLGKVTGDKDTENEGKVDQAKSSLKDAGEKITDTFKS
jgi:uncharacterized protein YjbJ (UPF0337 family)